MKNLFLIYDNCCFYEIVTLNYFMKFCGEAMTFCSVDGNKITTIEGYSVNADSSLKDVDIDDIKSFTITGGNISTIDNKEVYAFINKLASKDIIISAICAGVDVLDNAGVLETVSSTHSEDVDVMVDNNIITARANGHVDFAIEVAKKLELFKDEKDLQETINFWKYHNRM